jgi:glycosyltransferase involved in cell wall biosynthesis
MQLPAADAGGRRARRPRPRTLWIVNHYASAPDRPSGTRHFDLARRLVERGFDVTIFASGFSHVSGREERLRRGQLFRIEWFDGIRFVWLRTTPYRGNDWRRQVNMLSFMVGFLVVGARRPAPDVVIGSTVHPFAALAAWLGARLHRAAFVFEVRDLWPQTLVDLGAMRQGSVGERVLRAIEAFLVRRAVAVITLLPGMVQYLGEQGLPAEDVHYLPNGVDLAAFDRAAARTDGLTESVTACLATIADLRSAGRVVFAYIGALGRVNAVETLIQAAAIAEERMPGRVGLIVVGDGPERAALELVARGIESVALRAPIQKTFVPIVLRAADAGVVHATATPVYRYGVSFNKLFECFAAARPVVYACTSADDPVARVGAGVSIPPNDPARLADAFIELATMTPSERARMGEAGRALVVRDHDIERLAGTLADIVRDATERRED